MRSPIDPLGPPQGEAPSHGLAAAIDAGFDALTGLLARLGRSLRQPRPPARPLDLGRDACDACTGCQARLPRASMTLHSHGYLCASCARRA